MRGAATRQAGHCHDHCGSLVSVASAPCSAKITISDGRIPRVVAVMVTRKLNVAVTESYRRASSVLTFPITTLSFQEAPPQTDKACGPTSMLLIYLCIYEFETQL